MSHSRSTFDMQTPGRSCRLSLYSGLLALVIALPCAPLLAATAGDVTPANTTSAPQEPGAWMSGGIGDEAREDMRKVAAAYNVHVMFSEQRGNYLAGIPFTVARLARGSRQQIYAAVSDGPLLYLKLPPGSYQIAAEIDGVWQSQQVQAGAPGSLANVSFMAKAR
ncbi:hypothetical protein [Candidatus Accumulibacter vicinus]|uniref:Carboxypeptidase regulatory-like domain-containing protein n=1 Tax=Candidatus Accumulibacter vicinus TaxID=2954382 RepID=A0A084XXK6_9PROT|nr:hypothetical protein [Candidatus Accumulibacter vicinus]KFB67200.1 MAG: hypothetical protein CAPSK01_003317 [Candidatus Accumulibacter vicinus]